MVKLKTKPRNLFLLDAIHHKAGKHSKSNKARRKREKQDGQGLLKNTFDNS